MAIKLSVLLIWLFPHIIVNVPHSHVFDIKLKEAISGSPFLTTCARSRIHCGILCNLLDKCEAANYLQPKYPFDYMCEMYTRETAVSVVDLNSTILHKVLEEIEACLSDPCQNQGTCVDDINSYTCFCVAGYTGVHCETDIDECGSDPCQNEATCIDDVNSYSCQCVDGHTGVHCETDIDECGSDPCQNEATCIDDINSYSCQCVDGHTGVHCETGGCPLPEMFYDYVVSHCYYFDTSTSRSFEDSLTFCSDLLPGAYLVDILSQDEHDAIIGIITANSFLSSTVDHYRTSGKRPDGGALDDFVWTISGNPVVFESFDYGQPNALVAADACIILTKKKYWNWNDGQCDLSSYFGTICKF